MKWNWYKLKIRLQKFGSLISFTYICPMETIRILPRTKKLTFEFYTEDHEGNETIHGVKTLIHPDKCKLYLKLQKEGFANRRLYGFRAI